MVYSDNTIKWISGYDFTTSIEYALKSLDDLKILKLKSGKQDTQFTHQKFPVDKDRFKIKYLLEFTDEKDPRSITRIGIFRTTSIRDRIKQNQWDACCIRQIRKDIDFFWLITPNDESYDKGKGIVSKINKGETYSAIDKVLTVDAFIDSALDIYRNMNGVGKADNKAGQLFERIMVDTMASQSNLKKFNHDSADGLVGFRYELFQQTMNFFGVKSGELSAIRAKASIPHLPSGGKPKTDVLLEFHYRDGRTESKTISCKNSSASAIQVNQFDADLCAQVLAPKNTDLRSGLKAYEKAGYRIGNMKDRDKMTLTRELSNYKLDFLRWCLGGFGSQTSTPIQNADYLAFRDRNDGKVYFHKTEEMCKKIDRSKRYKGSFQSGLTWTYNSSGGSTHIQVKINTNALKS